MTIAIKPTASGSTIEQNGSTILTVDGSGNITPSNNLYPKVPAFRVYRNGNQTISANTWTKVIYDTESLDNTSSYDHATNYRFTPQVEGWYYFSYGISSNGSTSSYVALYKNGSNVQSGDGSSSGATIFGRTGSGLVYLNGSTDYVEVYVNQSNTTVVCSTTNSYFTGFLVSV